MADERPGIKTRAKMIAAFATVEEAHAKLEQVLAAGEHPLAECRIDDDPSSTTPHQVWEGPAYRPADE